MNLKALVLKPYTRSLDKLLLVLAKVEKVAYYLFNRFDFLLWKLHGHMLSVENRLVLADPKDFPVGGEQANAAEAANLAVQKESSVNPQLPSNPTANPPENPEAK